MYGIQAWAALPKAHEEDQASFAHYDAQSLPRIAGEGKTVRLIMGSLYGQSSPAEFPHACFYAEAVLAPGAVLPLDADYDERAIYIVSGEVASAGGYMVQLLPEVAEGPLMVMTERLRDFEDIVPLLARGAASPEKLLAETLYGMPYTKVGDRNVSFGCQCSPERLVTSLASLPRADIESLMSDGKPLEIECDYCRKRYDFTQQELRHLLEAPN